MVDIVGLKNSPEHLLHVVGIFIDAARATDAGNGIRAVLGNDGLKFRRHQIEGFIPGGLAELAVFFADERCFQPVFRIDKIIGKPALDAQFPVIRRPVFNCCYFDDLFVFDVQQLLTADAAVRTGGADFLRFPGASQPLAFILRQRTDGTGLDALAAKHALTVRVGAVATGDNFAFLAAIALRDGTVDNNLVAGLYAASAENAAAEVAHDETICIFHRIDVFFILFGKLKACDLIKIRQILKYAAAVGFAGHAVVPAGRQDKFDVHFSGFMDKVAFGFDVHAWRQRCGAGGHQRPGPFDFHAADPASAGRRCSF